MIRPIRWHGDALELLDQRRLPAEQVWLRCETVEDVAQAIEGLAVRGAPAIGIAAACGLVLGVRQGPDGDPAGGDPSNADLSASFENACRRLLRTRPTAVNLGWALERARSEFQDQRWPTRDAAATGLRALADRLLREQTEADRRLAEAGAALLGPGARVFTHCNTGALATAGSGTAGGVIRTAWEMGRLAMVWVGETRPLLQGARLTTWELQQAGIPFRLVTDSSAGLLMAKGLVDGVIVGADRIAANGDVANKIGTYPLAVLAHHHGVPFYVAAPLSSIDHSTRSGAEIPIELREPAEVTSLGGTAIAPPGSSAQNWAFDITPAELVGAIITEAGVLNPPLAPSISALAG